MPLIDITDGNFRETYTNNEIIILDFWAPWCGPCQAFAPIFEEVSKQYPEIVFGKVNTEEEQKLALHFQIRSIPTIMVIRDQLEVFFQPGLLPEEQLIELIAAVKNLDMGEVRRKIEEEEAKNN
ncbi:MAG: thioredoxin [Bdellovibrionaceae bacterium]|nr:thioredoxin [Bdellovibrionales bacterium]MCB9084335.1 thioredoxin [Pseudobdellovibrionaceae bacterium]